MLRNISIKKGQMIGSDKIFFDTSPFIYLVENHPKYSQPVTDFIVNQIYLHESLFFTSTITLVEFYAKPKKNNDLVVIDKFKRKIREFNFTVFDLTTALAEFSGDLRAKYDFLKAFDAIQLATAVDFGCNKFFTNDKKLKSIQEINVILVEDLI